MPQCRDDLFQCRMLCRLANPELLGYRRQDSIVAIDRCQRNPADTICEFTGALSSDRIGKSGLPNATRPGQRDEPNVWIAQKPCNIHYLAPTPDQRRELGR